MQINTMERLICLMIPKLGKEQFRQVYEKGFEATYALFDALQQAVEALENRVSHLEAILAKDSHNSSKPPSSNGFKRPPKSLRQKSGKKAGGQQGHAGSTMRQVENPDLIRLFTDGAANVRVVAILPVPALSILPKDRFSICRKSKWT